MPLLSYSVSDFVAFTIIRSADVNSRFSDIQTLLNTTKLDDDNIQDNGITRASKLKNGTADTIVTNAPTTGELSEINIVSGGLLSKNSSGALVDVGAGTQGQILSSNASGTPAWIDTSQTAPSHYIRSGAVNSDGQQDYIRPDGGGADDFTIRATTTNLVIVIENTETTLSADINVTGLDAPVNTNNTASVNNPNAADEEWTKTLGEDDLGLTYDSGGTNFLPSGGEGKLHAFKVNDGSTDEYFIGRFTIDSTSTAGTIQDCRRGYFSDSSGTAIPRIAIADNDTLTIQKLFWVFVSDAGAATATDIEPIESANEPTNVNGQMWFDTVNQQWNRSNGSSFSTVQELLIGQVIVDENDEVVGARSCDFFAQLDPVNTTDVAMFGDTQVIMKQGSKVNVLGQNIEYFKGQPIFDITDTDVRVGTEDASTTYYLYISKTGQEKMEATAPYLRPDLKGSYHPHKPWRCVGRCFNDSSSDIVYALSEQPQSKTQTAVLALTSTGGGVAKGTVTIDHASWKQDGDDMVLKMTYLQTTGGTLGTGTYLWQIPDGFTIDLDKFGTLDTANEETNVCGAGAASASTNLGTGHCKVYDDQNIALAVYSGTAWFYVGSGFAGISLSGARYSFEARFPIREWGRFAK